MRIPCDIILDLLPLYRDDACNANCKAIVEEHLTGCESCKSVLKKIEDDTVEKRFKVERDDIVYHHAQAVKKKSLAVGISIAPILAVPILISLIVNLATGHALDWFFIVLTALATLASVTVVPLVFEKEKALWTLGSFTVSLSLLLLTCSLYSGGDWFFVAVTPVLFGLSVLFAPYVIAKLPLTGFWTCHKGLLAMAADTVLLYAVVVVSGLYGHNSSSTSYWHPALAITTACLVFPWGLFLIIRYLKSNALVKAGLSTVFGGLFLSVIESIVCWVTEGVFRLQFMNANLHVWYNGAVLNSNIYLVVMLAGCIVGGILTAVGLSRQIKK